MKGIRLNEVMEYSLQVQIDQLNQCFNELSMAVKQFTLDTEAYNNPHLSAYCAESDESLELPAMFRYLSRRIEKCGYKIVRYYLYLESPSWIQKHHKVLIFQALRSVCLKSFRTIYASKIVIELTEDTFGFLLEIAYHQVDPVVFFQASDSLAPSEALIEHNSGEMSAYREGDVLRVVIALPI